MTSTIATRSTIQTAQTKEPKTVMPRYILILLFCMSATAGAQEFRDTAGRWKQLDIESATASSATPRTMIAYR